MNPAGITGFICFIIHKSVKKMAFKFALLAAVCIAQGFAFQPFDAFRGKNACKNSALEIPYEFEEAMNEMDEVRESVSMAAMNAYAKGQDFEVVIACFRAQKENFEKLGMRISEMIRDASMEMAEKLGEKSDKYAKLMEVPLMNIAITVRTLPEKVYNFIKDKEFGKALEAMKEARRIVEENAKVLGKIVQDMAAEIPEMADEVEKKAREIRDEAMKGCATINEAIRKCVEEGGPKKIPASSDYSY